ncbi:MAG: diguanylate cyclase/phosphodiesterase (GGDEF & EAL domains) with PAS/PAC sensor(s) [uncultured Acidimicrobiales bacterium]|uniref:Diguanylate cyclase/phosphodiesterase (GGDEF & EAL domains) with PAS/PAC sensor(S) n=1 Tax=uncultured Acidimicrobiales bacterium TaxID=310071 RepID=A0A6J4H8G8_9ACTN|nr:MAG: diguanylate cyclase/phosphodiesterase (GGDEF & EAL domains) with PAS/PAC sensor(s) [uncultured Acidimicrobiales bacterium]
MKNGVDRSKLHRFVAATTILALLCLAAAAMAVRESPPPVLWRLFVIAAGFAAADAALVHLRFGHDRWSFNWSEVVVVVGLSVLPPPWIVLVAPVGVAVANLSLRRAPVKVIFNVGVVAVGTTAAWVSFSLVHALASDAGTVPTMLRLTAASLASWAVTTAAVSCAVAKSQNVPVGRVHAKALRMNLVVWVGNTTIGCLAVGVATAEPVALFAIPALTAMLAVIYRGYLVALEERDTWERLQAVSRQLLGADAESMAEVALDGALALLQAEFADLVLVEDERDRAGLGWRRSAGGPVERLGGDPFDLTPGSWGRVLSDRAPFTIDVSSSSGPQHAELVDLGLTSISAAPLLVHGRCLGTLRIGFRGPVRLRARERQVLETFANHISAAANAVQLFERLRSLALIDALTGLPNRAELTGRLRDAVADDGFVAVLFLDLDRFKVVNDSLGHQAGDRVLQEAAARLRAALPEGAIAGRFGGDEFVVVWPGMADEAVAADVAARLASAVAKPIEVDGSQLLLTASVGVVIASGRSATPAGLLRDADAAMYLAKERGRDRVELFTAAVRTTAVRRLELENELRAAVEMAELVVHYQPIVNLQDRRPVGAEALLRWHHPQRGLVPTTEFVALAEETRLILSLGAWVLGEAVGNLRHWDEVTGEPLGVSVNLSAHQLSSSRLVDEVVGILSGAGAEASRVTFEVTESSLVDLAGEAVGNLGRLRALGCTIALDDFGTGWSSLSYLQRLPVDCLKLDRSFVARLDEDGRDRAVVGSLVNLAHALGLVVVAEGVERMAQLDVLVDFGCDAAQGYLLQPPCAAEAMLRAVAQPGGCWPAGPAKPVPLFRTA